MEAKKEKAFPEALNDAISAYKTAPGEDTFSDLLCLLYDGIEEDASIPVPAEMDWDKMTIQPSFRPREDGNKALIVLTVPNGERFPQFADVRLRAIVRILLGTENCLGILFDPEEDTQLFLRKDLFVCAIGAGLGMLEEFEDQQEESDDTIRKMQIHRPVDEDAFSKIEESIRGFKDDPDDFLILDLIDDQEAEARRHAIDGRTVRRYFLIQIGSATLDALFGIFRQFEFFTVLDYFADALNR